jgi:hypothetical protein
MDAAAFGNLRKFVLNYFEILIGITVEILRGLDDRI